MDDILLQFDDITYASGEQRLEHLSFGIRRGENTVFFGVERSGIDLLLRLILGLDPGFEGDIRYKGRSIRGLDYFGRLAYITDIGYLHGDFGLMSNLTVEQNIRFPLDYHTGFSENEVREIVDRLITGLGLEHCRHRRPVQIFRSEIQKAAYARAIVQDPELLILEHPFANICPLDIERVHVNLRARARDPRMSVMAITFEPQKFLDFADTFIMLYEGRIVFTGTRQDFLESNDPYLFQYRGQCPEGPMCAG